jgi:hypothetical protein
MVSLCFVMIDLPVCLTEFVYDRDESTFLKRELV